MNAGSADRRWQRVEELFAWALERDPTTRAAELDARCAGDRELCAEVDSLLAAWASTDDFLETPATLRIAELAEARDSRRGTRIGRYRIERPLGRGGMGVVYEAWQDDPQRAVALKLVRGGSLADPLRVRRFQREAESLGRLDHPGIARIFEAGLDEASGDHWFAMELVRGRPLAEHVRTARPGRAELLGLFVRICQAVDHAHRQGIVHRDIKPSNVLVVPSTDGAPAVKVLDFGLAHCTAPDGADDESTQLTQPGRAYGTLPYMSPEQARGEPGSIGPASDVYALGVVLHELLTGRLPIAVEGLLLPAAVRRISETAPERPGRVDRSLRGDLETIVLKALEKEPARRYASAAELARDVERHLSGRPIAARRPSVGYQARKLVLRHRVFFGAAVLLCLLSAAAAVVSAVLLARAREAEARARVEALAAREVSGFLQEMLASAQPLAPPSDLTVREVLDRSAERLESATALAPAVEATLHATIGDSYRALGLFERAEQHLGRALAIRGTGSGSEAGRGKDLMTLAMVRLEQGRYAESETLARDAVALLRHAGMPQALALALVALGNALRQHADSADALREARGHYDEALALAEGLSDPALSANVLNEYGGVLAALGDNAGAEERYRRALELHRRCFGNADLRVAGDENDLAIVLARGDRLTEAVELTRHSLASHEQLLGRDHPTTIALVNNLGSLLIRGSQLDEGEALLREALEARRRLLGDTHPDVARTLSLLGQVARHRNRVDDARVSFGEALDIYRAKLGEFHVEVANAETSVAFLELEAQDPAAALPHARTALDVYRRVVPADHAAIPQSEALLGRVLVALGELDEAAPLLERAVETLAVTRGDTDPATQRALRDLSTLLRERGEPERANALDARARTAAGAPSTR